MFRNLALATRGYRASLEPAISLTATPVPAKACPQSNPIVFHSGNRQAVLFSGSNIDYRDEARQDFDVTPCVNAFAQGNTVAQKLPNRLNRRFAAYKEESTMKKLFALTTACILFAGLAFADQTNAADQKWLEVVQKKVAEGQTKVSTPIAERVTLLKDWAGKNGYTIAVHQSENGYRVELAKNVAQK